jgi:hypothetical protein
MIYKLQKIPLADCVHGRAYQIHSRNLAYGAFNSTNNGFIGIRTKFGYRYLATEYYDITVGGMHDMGIDVPGGILIKERLGSRDDKTGRPIVLDPKINNPNEGMEGEKGWWKFIDTGEAAPAIPEVSPVSVHNDALFKFLDGIEGCKP